MRNNAVLLTVLFALLVTVGSMSYAFYKMYGINKEKHTDHTFKKYTSIMSIFRQHLQTKSSRTILEANLAISQLYNISDQEGVKTILQEAEVMRREGFRAVNEALFHDKMYIYRQQFIEDMRATMFHYKKEIYFYIESPRYSVMLLDKESEPYLPWKILTWYVITMSILISSFLLILYKFYPLSKLRKKIARFGAGDMTVSFKTDGEDEIALISNELDQAQCQINTLMESRTLFLRNIMHELKKPIAKGRIVTQMLEDGKHKERYGNIFERLESLINEFALIEEVTSGFTHLQKKEYRLIDLVDGAIDMAMIEHDDVTVEVNANYKVITDFRLFSTAIKNMIDNALKYSPNHKVKVITEDNEIVFENHGAQLSHPLSFYVEPFTKEQPAKSSFGLGLYLVDAILKSHNMLMAYEHDKERELNRFIFVPEKQ
ncbi:MAG: ArsS family sensor histidine kinase [Campylobacterota bacterium]|nr:ArsS family sensor histidine kinase [Campylobacterota bacterium]